MNPSLTNSGVPSQDDLDELDAFNARVDEVQRLVQGLKDGSIDPAVLEAKEKEEERKRQEKQAKEQKRRELAAKKLAEKRAKEKKKERETWWERAEMLRGATREEVQQARKEGRNRKGVAEANAVNPVLDDDGRVLFPQPKKQGVDRLDYSVWDSWVPDDPVSLEEMHERKAKIDEENNKRFEEANPEFCSQFLEDQAKRQESQEKKRRKAEKAKLSGNKLMKRRDYAGAIKKYHDALKLNPTFVPALTNLAQAHLKRKEYDDALEYCDRALFVQPDCVKALWRRARALKLLGRFKECVFDLKEAAELEPENEDVASLLAKARDALFEAEAEAGVSEKLESLAPFEAIESPDNIAHMLKNPPSALRFLAHVAPLFASHADDDGKAEKRAVALECLPKIVENDMESLVYLRTSNMLHSICSWVSCLPKRISMVHCLKALTCACGAKGNVPVVASHDAKPLRVALDCLLGDKSEDVISSAPNLFAKISVHESHQKTLFFAKDALMECLPRTLDIMESKRVGIATRSASCDFVTNLLSTKTARSAVLSANESSSKRIAAAVLSVFEDVAANVGSSAASLSLYEGPCRIAIAMFQIPEFLHAESGRLLKQLACAAKMCASNDFLLVAAASGMLNACHDDSAPTAQAVFDQGAAASLLSALSPSRSLQAQSRCASLLAKCCHHEGIRNIVLNERCWKRLVATMQRARKACDSSLKPGFCLQNSKHYELLEHCIRCIAVAMKLSNAASGKCMELLTSSGATQDMVEILRAEATEVRKKRDEGKPGKEHRRNLRANLLQLFVTLVRSANVSSASSCALGACIKTGLIPLLIAVLAGIDDPPIRKNAAIALAGIARSGNASYMEEIRAHRGMEMLVELGNTLTH